MPKAFLRIKIEAGSEEQTLEAVRLVIIAAKEKASDIVKVAIQELDYLADPSVVTE